MPQDRKDSSAADTTKNTLAELLPGPDPTPPPKTPTPTGKNGSSNNNGNNSNGTNTTTTNTNTNNGNAGNINSNSGGGGGNNCRAGGSSMMLHNPFDDCPHSHPRPSPVMMHSPMQMRPGHPQGQHMPPGDGHDPFQVSQFPAVNGSEAYSTVSSEIKPLQCQPSFTATVNTCTTSTLPKEVHVANCSSDVTVLASDNVTLMELYPGCNKEQGHMGPQGHPHLHAHGPHGQCGGMHPSMMHGGPGGKMYPPNQPMIFNASNPNAPPIYPCGVCHKEVHENDQAILCESGCNFWFHRMCVGLTEDAFHMLKSEVYAEWVCDRCFNTRNVALIKFKP